MGTIKRAAGASGVAAAPTDPAHRPESSLLSVLLAPVLCWMDRARQRRALQALDGRLLRDIGLSRADVELEASKWFWQT